METPPSQNLSLDVFDVETKYPMSKYFSYFPLSLK